MTFTPKILSVNPGGIVKLPSLEGFGRKVEGRIANIAIAVHRGKLLILWSYTPVKLSAGTWTSPNWNPEHHLKPNLHFEGFKILTFSQGFSVFFSSGTLETSTRSTSSERSKLTVLLAQRPGGPGMPPEDWRWVKVRGLKVWNFSREKLAEPNSKLAPESLADWKTHSFPFGVKGPLFGGCWFMGWVKCKTLKRLFLWNLLQQMEETNYIVNFFVRLILFWIPNKTYIPPL